MVLIQIIPLICLILVYTGNSEKLSPESDAWKAKHLTFISSMDEPEDRSKLLVTKNQVTFHLFSNSHAESGIELNEEQLEHIKPNADRIFFLAHGWLEHKDRPWYKRLKDVLLKTYPKSVVIQVDYSEPAFNFYLKCVTATEQIGQLIGEFIAKINQKWNVSPKKIVLIAHSMGSDIAGLTGRAVKKTLPSLGRIISLDPAHSRFAQGRGPKRLNGEDADVVEVIHTDIGLYGHDAPLGTIDFYPNGGGNQPGCPIIENFVAATDDTMCNHWRSWEYFIEAVANPTHFLAKRCKDYETYVSDPQSCDSITVALGAMETTEKGQFFFKTRDVPPFAVESKKLRDDL